MELLVVVDDVEVELEILDDVVVELVDVLVL